ncbi:uncharacterized protein LOC111947739 isoform X1 [Oryzias latipes]|uniref:uncharacterized protein LOC111946393 n=1 Tax=Oryzias latipes TaxID=8090 RepID=UPI000CE1E6F9|nr:uncharacterized protein LOC111946393 [Oryzias latipes]XP_023813203.1 uncharacterized protein LOC111947739 isoform X1 [Oryzias latipes]
MTERTGHSPDPADPEGLRFAVTQQGIALGRQAESLNQMATVQQDLFRRLDGISHALMDLTGQQSSIAAASTSFSATGSPGPAIANAANENIRLQPEVFHGDVKACGGFLLQCRLIFQQAPRHYHADQSKITLIVNSLRGKALQWAQAFLTANPIHQVPFERFINEFCLVFDQPRKEEEATRRLLALRQRSRSVRGPPEEPMQIGHSKLTPEERQRRRDEGTCFYCGQSGHLVHQCTLRLNAKTPR